MQIKVCHMTNVHRSDDTRIFHKQCVSLAKAGYEVYLVSNGRSYTDKGVKVIGIDEKANSRVKRMILIGKRIYETAVELNADIYHLHDPELLLFALKLKRKGKKVIFDSHEDYLFTIPKKKWIPRFLRPIVKKVYEAYEKYVVKRIDGVIVCYHWTEERLSKYNKNIKMILNYPIVESNGKYPLIDFEKRSICFAGGITEQWCHKEILKAIGRLTDVTYELAGKLSGAYGMELQQMKEWSKVNYHGIIPLERVFTDVYARSCIGMALLDYIPQCRGSIGNLSNTKFFEYMSMGLPLICTDFILWKEIIDKYSCGICVNPHDIDSISRAIDYILNNPSVAKKMGENGRKAVINKYNWHTEETKLLELYSKICNNYLVI